MLSHVLPLHLAVKQKEKRKQLLEKNEKSKENERRNAKKGKIYESEEKEKKR